MFYLERDNQSRLAFVALGQLHAELRAREALIEPRFQEAEKHLESAGVAEILDKFRRKLKKSTLSSLRTTKWIGPSAHPSFDCDGIGEDFVLIFIKWEQKVKHVNLVFPGGDGDPSKARLERTTSREWSMVGFAAPLGQNRILLVGGPRLEESVMNSYDHVDFRNRNLIESGVEDAVRSVDSHYIRMKENLPERELEIRGRVRWLRSR